MATSDRTGSLTVARTTKRSAPCLVKVSQTNTRWLLCSWMGRPGSAAGGQRKGGGGGGGGGGRARKGSRGCREWECTAEGPPLLCHTPSQPLLGQEDYQSAPCCTLSGVHFHRDGNDFDRLHARTHTRTAVHTGRTPHIHRVGWKSQSFSHIT